MLIKVYFRDKKDPIEYSDCGYFIGTSARTEVIAPDNSIRTLTQYQNIGTLTITKTVSKGGKDVTKNVAVFARGIWAYFECV